MDRLYFLLNKVCINLIKPKNNLMDKQLFLVSHRTPITTEINASHNFDDSETKDDRSDSFVDGIVDLELNSSTRTEVQFLKGPSNAFGSRVIFLPPKEGT